MEILFSVPSICVVDVAAGAAGAAGAVVGGVGFGGCASDSMITGFR